VGRSALFLHRELGPRVRLGTLFTDCPLTEDNAPLPFSCGECRLCVNACPAGAIKGVDWRAGIEREEIFDAEKCNGYMRAYFMDIGRGAVCGICMKVCPRGSR
jgi:epoxyqueuosine reductase QueG